MLDTGYWMSGCWILDIGFWMDAGLDNGIATFIRHRIVKLVRIAESIDGIVKPK
jgi:hypothetical protein